MCVRNRFVFVCIIILAFTSGLFARMLIRPVSVSSRSVSLELADSQCVGSTPMVVSIGASEGSLPQVHIENIQGRCYGTVKKAGFVGQNYFVFFAIDSLRADNQHLNVVISLNFDRNVYQATNVASMSVNNNSVQIPLVATLRKTARTQSYTAPPFRRGLRIAVDKDGIYALTGDYLAQHGVPIGSTPLERYRLFVNNLEMPLYLSTLHRSTMAPSDTLMFYGKALRGEKSYWSQFSNTNAYWLTFDEGRGVRVALADGTPRRDPTRYGTGSQNSLVAQPFYDTIHVEEDNDIRWLGGVGTVTEMASPLESAPFTDAWYWDIVGENKITTVPFTVQSPLVGKMAQIRVALMGLSANQQASPDHNLQILINNQALEGTDGTIHWDGQTPYVYSSPSFDSKILVNGTNTLSFITASIGFPDQSALNYIEVLYTRGFTATDDRLYFHSAPSDTQSVRQFTLEGFSSPAVEIWDIDNMRLITGGTVKNTGTVKKPGFTLVFQDSIKYPSHFIAQTIRRRLAPGEAVLDTMRDVAALASTLDHLVITKRAFVGTSTVLSKFHTAHNLPSAVFCIEDIYNWYTAGVTNPEAIRMFVTDCCSRFGDHIPSYLLLAGDATHDAYKNVLRSSQTVVPTHLSTVPGWGVASDDGYFGTVLGDDLFPDVCVGRLPASDTAQLALMIAKTIQACTTRDYSPWRDNVLLLGGYEPPFTLFNSEVSEYTIGGAMNIERLDAEPTSSYYRSPGDATSQCVAAINAGTYLINFNGHGGGNVWSDNNFFTIPDVARLYNDRWKSGPRLPIVASFTCLTGFFESIFYPSLGEEFLRSGTGGAVAFFGASAYTSREGNLVMNRIFLNKVSQTKKTTVGSLINQTKIAMLAFDNPGYIPLIAEYNLLGDPALVFETIPDSLELALTVTSDALTSAPVVLPIPALFASTQIIADSRTLLTSKCSVANNTISPVFVALKDSLVISSGSMRMYAWNDTAGVKGTASFCHNTIGVLRATINPPQPHPGDTIRITCTTPPATGVTMRCLFTVDKAGISTASFPAAQELSMNQIDSSTWQSSTIVVPAIEAAQDLALYVSFRLLGTTTQSRTFQFPLAGIADIRFTSKKIRFGFEADSFICIGECINTGTAPATPLSIALFEDSTMLGVWNSSSSIGPGKIAPFALRMPDLSGVHVVRVKLNYNNAVYERYTDDNESLCTLSVAFQDMKTLTDTLKSVDNGCALALVNQPTSPVRLFIADEQIDSVAPFKTPSAFVSVGNNGARAYSLWTRPAEVSSLKNFAITLTPLDSSSSVHAAYPHTALASADSLTNAWRVIEGSVASLVPAPVSVPLRFCAVAFADQVPPSMSVYVGGRKLAFFDYAAKDRSFDVTMNDQTGIDQSSIRIRLNGSLLDSSRISGSSLSNQGQTLRLTLAPNKQSSIDSLTITAADWIGNDTSITFKYIPGENLSIKFLSCHPNPLRASVATGEIRARFAFVLTDIAEHATLAIYTQSGKKIREFSLYNVIGYQEIAWDGATQHGYRIANGLYYAKLTVSNGSKKATCITRIAKLEGY